MPVTVLDVRDAGLGALYGARLALVRPDQHIAWRGDRVVDAAALVDRVRGAAAAITAQHVARRMAS